MKNEWTKEIERLKAINRELLEALEEIIKECPNPKTGYGVQVVKLATEAIKKATEGP